MKKGFFAGAVLLTLTALGAIPVLAADTGTPYETRRIDAPDPQALGRFAERVVSANDVNNDGTPDFFVAVPRQDLGSTEAGVNAGLVYLISGADRAILKRFEPPELQKDAQFGFFINAIDDVDGKGEFDIAIGTDSQDVAGNVDQGKAYMFSSETGAKLYEMDNPEPQSSARFGSRIGRAGDITGDGVADVIVGASNNDLPRGCGTDGTVEAECRPNEGQAFIFDGKDGTLRRTLELPEGDRLASGTRGSLGLAVQGPGDVNRDGVVDQLVDAATYQADGKQGVGRMYLFSGKDGSVLRKIDSPQPEPFEFFGFQDATPLAPGDVNNDGFPDLYGNGFLADGPTGEGQGRAWVFSGRDGSILKQIDDPTPNAGGQFGWSLARTDFNQDNRPDLYIGQSPHHVPGGDQNGGTYVFDGRDFSVFKRFEVPESDRQDDSLGTNAGPRLGWTVAAPGDLNRDGEPDYLGGAPFSDVIDDDIATAQDRGVLFVYLSRVTCPRGTSPTVICSRLPGGRLRFTGTPLGETFVGTSNADVIDAGAGPDRIIAVAGDDFVNADAGDDFVRGGTGDDRMAGRDGDDRIVGDQGDDVLTGGDGADHVTGEAGEDFLAGREGDDRLGGGSGNDRFRGDQGDDFLAGQDGNDLLTGQAGNDRLFGGEGRDRLDGGSGNNVLRQ